MATEDDFQPRLGRLRARGSPRGRRYLQHVLRAVARAGGGLQRQAARRRHGFRGSRLGRAAAIGHALAARDYVGRRQRRVVIKSRIVKLVGKGLDATRAHLRYIQRDGVTPQGEPGQLYDARLDHADGKGFLARCEGDRHQFRFIVAAEDAAEYPDLKLLIRRLTGRMEEDLGTKLEWVAVDHYNTGHPHTHVLLRGKDDRDKDLVIARDYISRGMRERAAEIVTLDLGPQSDLEIERKLQQEVDQERFTSLDRSLLRDAGPDRVLTIRSGAFDPSRHAMKMGRLRKLQQLGLANEVEPGRWNLAEDLENQLRELGARGDVIKTLNRELKAMGAERALSDYAVPDAGGAPRQPVVGRILRKGLADELNDRHFIIVDGVDGRVHYVDIGKGEPVDPMPGGAIVSAAPRSSGVRRSDRTVLEIATANGGQYNVDNHLRHDRTATAEFAEAHIRRLEAIRRTIGGVKRKPDGTWLIGQDHLDRAAEYERARTRTEPVIVQVLSAWSLEQQANADGATWMDRELVSSAPTPLREAGFGQEVRRALDRRRRWLIQEKLAHEKEDRVLYRSNLLAVLRQRELTRVAAQLYGHEELADNWVFKGGTCLKKCFFETYRFSEDLDFTLLKPEHIDADFLKDVFAEIGEWIYEQTGIEIPADKQVFDIYQNPRGQLSCQGKISYKGPVSSTHGLPRIKLDLTADERVVLPPVRVQIFHPYTDAPEGGIEVLAYDYVEAFAEKFRALVERTRPRDLYDVVHLYRNGEARPEPQRFMEVLRAKCEFKGIGIPRITDLDPHRADLEAGWIHMLEHQLPALLPVATFWEALPEIFAWLEGAVAQPLAAMPIGAGDTLIRERIIGLPAGGQSQNFVEMIRFAAANRLLVEIDYRDKQGNRSTRAIEAYSFRRSQAGDVLLMAVRADSGQSRSYLVDRILGVRTTQTPFSPRYPIELTPFGPQSMPRTSSGSGGGFGMRHMPVIRRSPARRSTRSAGIVGASGPSYVFRCSVCGKTFNKKSYDATLNKHKNNRTGYDCYGTFGTYVRTKY